MLKAPGWWVQSADSSPGLSGTQAYALSTTLGWVSVIGELVNGLRFSSLADFWVRTTTRGVICPKSVPTWAPSPVLGFSDLREDELCRTPWSCAQDSVWVYVDVFLARGPVVFIGFSEGSMTQKRLITCCFRHYFVWCSPLTDEEMDFLNSIFYFKLLLFILERQQHSLHSSPMRSFRYCTSAVETSQRGQTAGWGASTAFFIQKWRVPKEGRAGSLPKVSRTMSVLYTNQGHAKRVDPRITPDNSENWLFRPDKFWESTWLSQMCTLNPGPNSF